VQFMEWLSATELGWDARSPGSMVRASSVLAASVPWLWDVALERQMLALERPAALAEPEMKSKNRNTPKKNINKNKVDSSANNNISIAVRIDALQCYKQK
jgi:hypothetical protein